jgi:CPA1 family monovalent cation:H+ antiporter
VSILEGEGLFNDVTAITLYHVAIGAALSGTFSPAAAATDLLLAAAVAVAAGLGLGWVTARLLDVLGDATLRTGMTLLMPFAAYVLAEELGGSGVLAVLVVALYLGEHAADPDDVTGRLTGRSFWAVIDTMVTGVAFGLIGLELHVVMDTVSDGWRDLLPAAALVLATVVVVRLLWLLPAAWLTRRLHHLTDAEEIPGTWRETVVMWWSGMRGVASVALALAVPLTVDDGGPFPQRDAIVFLGFTVVVGTLLLQGLTLPWLTERLGVRADDDAEEALEHELALRASRAAKRRLRELADEGDLPEDLAEALARRAYDIGARISPRIEEEERREHVARRAAVPAARRAAGRRAPRGAGGAQRAGRRPGGRGPGAAGAGPVEPAAPVTHRCRGGPVRTPGRAGPARRSGRAAASPPAPGGRRRGRSPPAAGRRGGCPAARRSAPRGPRSAATRRRRRCGPTSRSGPPAWSAWCR